MHPVEIAESSFDSEDFPGVPGGDGVEVLGSAA